MDSNGQWMVNSGLFDTSLATPGRRTLSFSTTFAWDLCIFRWIENLWAGFTFYKQLKAFLTFLIQSFLAFLNYCRGLAKIPALHGSGSLVVATIQGGWPCSSPISVSAFSWRCGGSCCLEGHSKWIMVSHRFPWWVIGFLSLCQASFVWDPWLNLYDHLSRLACLQSIVTTC